MGQWTAQMKGASIRALPNELANAPPRNSSQGKRNESQSGGDRNRSTFQGWFADLLLLVLILFAVLFFLLCEFRYSDQGVADLSTGIGEPFGATEQEDLFQASENEFVREKEAVSGRLQSTLKKRRLLQRFSQKAKLLRKRSPS
eukprot:scpid63190/ scgid29794/ 